MELTGCMVSLGHMSSYRESHFTVFILLNLGKQSLGMERKSAFRKANYVVKI